MRVVILLLAILALSAFVGCQAKPMVVLESGFESEGIKVHGDWTVEVTNPDGSLATRKQFTNSFTGQHIVAALLSDDQEEVLRKVDFTITDKGTSDASDEAACEESEGVVNLTTVLANTIHAPNENGEMFNSVWNAACTLEITVDEPKFLNRVTTRLSSSTNIPKNQGDTNATSTLSTRVIDEPIEVWNGQGISATVILSVK